MEKKLKINICIIGCRDTKQKFKCTLPISKVHTYLPIIWKIISAVRFHLRYHFSELNNAVFYSSQVGGEAWVRLIKSVVVDSERVSFSMIAKSFSFQTLEEEHSWELARSISVFLYDMRSIRNTIHYTVTQVTNL